MSEIRWCDTGGHPFSANDPDKKQYAETRFDEKVGRGMIDVCGPCLKSDEPVFKSFGPPTAKAVSEKIKDADLVDTDNVGV